MDVLPQASNQIISLPLEYITGRHDGFIVSELDEKYKKVGSFVVFLGNHSIS